MGSHLRVFEAGKSMTAFSEEVIAALDAPLAREHVKEREQAGRKLSYIEGWHVIAEANRIFGFDGWSRETVMSECCYSGEYERPVWENGRKTNRTVTSFRCTYRARVRIRVAGLIREGSGHGNGFADNPGDAHESAEKEAETDAMKRALMTFGNPFGLALYDKAQANVEAPARPHRGIGAPHHAAGGNGTSPATRNDAPATSEWHDKNLIDIRDRIYAALQSSNSVLTPDVILKVNQAEMARLEGDAPKTHARLVKYAAERSEELGLTAPVLMGEP
jgi:DNA recombination protein Rad52